jgi:mannose-6-phosphate isomerase-like protein (cupin superfamily)
MGGITLEGIFKTFQPGETILIKQGTKHRIKNTTANKVVLIEVQTGAYFGEDNIVRIEDIYNKS